MFTKTTASLAFALAASVAPLAIAAAPANAAPAPCPTGTWSSTAQGRPANLAPGSAAGMYQWHDGDGWHVRFTHPGTNAVLVTGVIDSVGTGPFDVATVAAESRDLVGINPAKGKIVFRIVNKGRIDGFDFKVGCVRRFTVSAQVNGAPIANANVYLGAGSVNPLSVPYTMERS